MMELFYNSTLGAWFDYDLDFSRHNTNFYMASFVPLFTGCYKFTDSKDVEKTLEYLKVRSFLYFFVNCNLYSKLFHLDRKQVHSTILVEEYLQL